MGGGGEGFEVLAGEGGVGDGEEGVVPFGLLGEVAVAEDLRGGGLGESEGGERKQAGYGTETGQVAGPRRVSR